MLRKNGRQEGQRCLKRELVETSAQGPLSHPVGLFHPFLTEKYSSGIFQLCPFVSVTSSPSWDLFWLAFLWISVSLDQNFQYFFLLCQSIIHSNRSGVVLFCFEGSFTSQLQHHFQLSQLMPWWLFCIWCSQTLLSQSLDSNWHLDHRGKQCTELWGLNNLWLGEQLVWHHGTLLLVGKAKAGRGGSTPTKLEFTPPPPHPK